MKVKLNLNVETVKRLLVQHGEKVAFGLAVFVLLWFFWNTVQLEKLGADKDPAQLTSLADRARQYVINSPWDPAARNIRIEDYPARAKHEPLSDADYPPLAVFFDKPLWIQHDKRPIPQVLPVEELVVHSQQGVLAVKRSAEDGPKAEVEVRSIQSSNETRPRGARLSGDTVPKGYFYVSVTGLVPVRKQIGIFDEAFRSALRWDPKRDQPVYIDIKVERAKVTGSSLKGIAWEPIDLAAVGNFMNTWSGDAVNDVVDDDYLGIQDRYTMPLGPLLGQDWDPVVVGHPKIPLAARFDHTKKPDKETATAPADRGVGWGHRPTTKKSGGAVPQAKSQPQVANAVPAGPKRDQKLFRFVDYTVGPGKQYRYRVKLVLENPNQEVNDRFLKVPEKSHTPMLESDWSEPTPVVSVPRGYSIYAGPVNVKPGVSPRDPEIEACIVGFDAKRGGEPAAKKLVQRGTLLNVSAKELWVLTPDHTSAAKWDKVDVRSNALIVDVQGGRKLSNREKSLVAPVEMLVLDADGHASVRGDIEDAEEFHARLDLLDQSDRPREPASTTPSSTNPYERPSRPRGGGERPERPARSATPRASRAPAN